MDLIPFQTATAEAPAPREDHATRPRPEARSGSERSRVEAPRERTPTRRTVEASDDSRDRSNFAGRLTLRRRGDDADSGQTPTPLTPIQDVEDPTLLADLALLSLHGLQTTPVDPTQELQTLPLGGAPEVQILAAQEVAPLTDAAVVSVDTATRRAPDPGLRAETDAPVLNTQAPDTPSATQQPPSLESTTPAFEIPVQPSAEAATTSSDSHATASGIDVSGGALPVPATEQEVPLDAQAAEAATRSGPPRVDASTGMVQHAETPHETRDSAPDRALAHQVTRAITQQAADGQRVLQLRLTPPELGTVRIEITEQAGGGVQVRLSAEDDGVRAALERAIPTMRTELRNADSMVNELQLADGQLGFLFDQAQEQAFERHAGGHARSRGGSPGDDASAEAPAPVDHALGVTIGENGVDARA